MATRPSRDWIQISVTALPGLAAVIALIFTWLSINATTNATNHQLQITEQGQITDRYNAAITNLGSSSDDIRLGGIYALQRIMQDSPRDQPTIVAVLCAFVRGHAKAATDRSGHPSAPHSMWARSHPPTDIQAALTVVGRRHTDHDGSATFVDLSGAELAFADLTGAHLTGAYFAKADLFGAYLAKADLTKAYLYQASLSGAYLVHANLARADLTGAYLVGANFLGANLTHADLSAALFTGADFTGAILTGTIGLPPGIPRSPASSTPASTKNLRRWATRLAARQHARVVQGTRKSARLAGRDAA